ncbi:MAG TPA: NUDIX domain-containing protein [Polyangiaceae bacterium]|nr:NUDIX domain-containing protein [Polyangiaceae bacterium]
MPPTPQAGPIAVVAVGAVVVDRAARILLVRRGRAPDVGAWTLPGGRVEASESLECAIVREVREETSLAARVVCPLGVVAVTREGFAYAIHEHLLVPLEEGDAPLVAGDDAADARWATRDVLERLRVRREAIDVIERGLREARKRRLAR